MSQDQNQSLDPSFVIVRLFKLFKSNDLRIRLYPEGGIVVEWAGRNLYETGRFEVSSKISKQHLLEIARAFQAAAEAVPGWDQEVAERNIYSCLESEVIDVDEKLKIHGREGVI